MVHGRRFLAATCLLLLHGTFSNEECSISDHEDGRCVRPDYDDESFRDEGGLPLEEEPPSERALLVSRKDQPDVGGNDVERLDPDSMKVTFENVADKGFTVFWVAADGSANPIDVLVARARSSLNTFFGHTFRLQAEDGETYNFVMKAGVTYIVVPPRQSKDAPPKEAAARRQPDSEDRSPGWRLPPKVLGDPDSVLDHRELDLLKTFSEGIDVMFWNLCDKELVVFFEDEFGSAGIKQDVFMPGTDVTTSAYADNTFCFTGRDAENVGCLGPCVKITVRASKYAYPVECGGNTPEAVRSQWVEVDKHNQEYFAKKGRHWVGSFPQAPPLLFMHLANNVGDVTMVRTAFPLEPAPPDMADPNLLNMTVISLEPRAFLIPQFLSSAEAQQIIRVGADKVRRSTTGGDSDGASVSDTRTSSSTFLPRSESPVLDRIFARAANLLAVSDTVINENSEDLQLVHYGEGQQYTPHNDWWHSKGGARYITLLMYLNTPKAGGHTAFPKAKTAGGAPVVVAPRTGSAVLFYNKLADGNSDELALHCSLPVREGEKWLANFWVWDPVKEDD